jgi:predicted transcriptional regulator
MYTLPQEVEVWYILPALRRDLSKELIRTHNVTYEKTGNLLGITKAAVSQYLSNKRAAKIKLHPKAETRVKKSADKIVRGKTDAVRELHEILKLIRKKGYHCEICGGMVDGKLHDCKQVVPHYFDD